MKRYITLVIIAAAVLALAACAAGDNLTDSATHYVYENDGFGGSFIISLEEDGTFTYYEGYYSSYAASGHWKSEGLKIILTDEHTPGGADICNTFYLNGNELEFIEAESTNFIYVHVTDGEKFIGFQGEDAKPAEKTAK